MKIVNIGNKKVAISQASDLFEKNYKYEHPQLDEMQQVGRRVITKAAERKKIAYPPFSMLKLQNLTDVDEYHSGCIDASCMASIMKVGCNDTRVNKWFEIAEYPACEDESTVLSEMLRYYLACGNGFLIKMRNAQGQWIGIERLLPSEVQIVEDYDDHGFFKPNYIQVKNNQKRHFPYADIIHIKKSTHRSSAWGLACLPIALNLEILSEIKTFDYNNFQNGLMADYFVIVEGGTLRDEAIIDESGKEAITNAYLEIERALSDAKGNSKSHSTILIESESPDVKIRLEPMRQQDRDGGFLGLKKDLREGIFAYHRVPPRVVSQLVSGQLGGDNNSDMTLFYHFVVKPLQNRIALTLSYEFNYEYGWNLRPKSWDFGKITDEIMTEDQRLFSSLRNN